MSEPEGTSRPALRRSVVAGALLVAILVVVIATWAVWGDRSSAPETTPPPDPSDTSSTPSQDPTGEDTASEEPSEEPTRDQTPDSTRDEESPTETSDPSEGTTGPRATLEPVAIDQEAEPVTGLTIRLVSIEAIEGVAAVPGERSGPAILVTLEGENSSTRDAHTPAVIVNVYFGAERNPANILVTPREDFPQTVAAGSSETGVFAFSVPLDQRDQVLIEVDLSLDMPIVLFEGEV